MNNCVSNQALEFAEATDSESLSISGEALAEPIEAVRPAAVRRPLVPLEEIIHQLQQMSAGGVPPGSERFTRETGIKNYEWHSLGLCWSDVVRAAGLQPHKLGGRCYTLARILGGFAAFTRELGRIPVQRDLLKRRRLDPEFPSSIVFQKFGNKGALVERVIAHCEKEGGWDDVIDICRKWLPKYLDLLHSGKWALDPATGCVYLIRYGGFYKVGKSTVVDRRSAAIRGQLPEGKGKLVHQMRTDDPAGIEAYWHRRFAAKRTNGEWFALSPEEVKAF
ncbi:MAG: GIY-YIG nuclease family protein, partial [Bryobacteraceae bacterium]